MTVFKDGFRKTVFVEKSHIYKIATTLYTKTILKEPLLFCCRRKYLFQQCLLPTTTGRSEILITIPFANLKCHTLSQPPFTSLTSIFNFLSPPPPLLLLSLLIEPLKSFSLFFSKNITLIDKCMQDIQQYKISVQSTNKW